MKITQSPQFSDEIVKESQYGLMQWASYTRIINAMIEAGELRLDDNEKIAGIQIDNKGLSLIIERK